MHLRAVAFSPSVGVHWGSDVERLSFDGAGLVITVACDVSKHGEVAGLEVGFSNASAFRYLDEVDLARYWAAEGFPFGSHVLEVQEGGWSDEENQRQGFDSKRREWLVVTGNCCVSVFSNAEPQVRSVSWKRDA